jgi:hypothetical protein
MVASPMQARYCAGLRQLEQQAREVQEKLSSTTSESGHFYCGQKADISYRGLTLFAGNR